MRVYTVSVPLPGGAQVHELATCDSLAATVELVRSLLAAQRGAFYRLEVKTETRPDDPGWQFPGEVR